MHKKICCSALFGETMHEISAPIVHFTEKMDSIKCPDCETVWYTKDNRSPTSRCTDVDQDYEEYRRASGIANAGIFLFASIIGTRQLKAGSIPGSMCSSCFDICSLVEITTAETAVDF